MLTVVVCVVTFGVVATVLGRQRTERARASDVERLIRAGQAASARPSEGELDEALLPDEALPPPVARYLRWAVSPGVRVQRVRVRQTGRLRTDLDTTTWLPFDAEHLVVPPAMGFVWNARVRMAPLLHLRVTDSYTDGQGSTRLSLLSAFDVGNTTGSPEMNSGALHRYLAESAWYPTALWPGPALRWMAIDANRALATLTDRGTSVSLEFRFADTGEMTGIYTAGRWGKFEDSYRQAPWEGHFRNYRDESGVRVPSFGEVGWYVNGVWRPVWEGTVTAFEWR
jgi:hypothetical protein